jgi:hypothetical protein
MRCKFASCNVQIVWMRFKKSPALTATMTLNQHNVSVPLFVDVPRGHPREMLDA